MLFLYIFSLLLIVAVFVYVLVVSRLSSDKMLSGTVLCDDTFLLTSSNAPGQTGPWCAINFVTGEKRCPSGGDTSIYADLSKEVCSRQYRCDFQTLSYPVNQLSDIGGTRNDQICEPNVECRCVNKPQCPNYIASVFGVESGNVDLPLDSQVFSLGQQTTYSNLVGANFSTPPLIYNNVSTQFCTINSTLLQFVSPGTCVDTGNGVDLVTCLTANPCMAGQLADIRPNKEEPNSNAELLFGCVNQPYNLNCPSGEWYKYDPVAGQYFCNQ